jgi:hypothetical protein
VSLLTFFITGDVTVEGEVAPSPSAGRIVAMVLVGLGALGFVGGPALGYVAMRRIQASEGRLCGLVLALLAVLAPALLVFDLLALAFLQATFQDVPPWVAVCLVAGLLYLNYRLGGTVRDRNMSDHKREWLSACLFFTASAGFLIASAIERDASYLKLAAGVVTWVAGFVSLVRLRPGSAAQLHAAADEPRQTPSRDEGPSHAARG